MVWRMSDGVELQPAAMCVRRVSAHETQQRARSSQFVGQLRRLLHLSPAVPRHPAQPTAGSLRDARHTALRRHYARPATAHGHRMLVMRLFANAEKPRYCRPCSQVCSEEVGQQLI